jgi:hypothetical protein
MKMDTIKVPSYFSPRPPIDLDAGTIAAFDRLLDESIQKGSATAIDYTLSAPKWQFLCYLCEAKDVLLHGSGNPDIQEFEPHQSNDTQEFGNRQAVYAASDGIWPMYFAIANRDGPVMSLVNACFRLLQQDGTWSIPYYFFSINDDAFEGNPWRNGTVYILPRATFEQQDPEDFKGIPAEIEQWASLVAVKPLARLNIAPDDFPFLSQVRAHDWHAISERARSDPDGFPWLEEAVSQDGHAP